MLSCGKMLVVSLDNLAEFSLWLKISSKRFSSPYPYVLNIEQNMIGVLVFFLVTNQGIYGLKTLSFENLKYVNNMKYDYYFKGNFTPKVKIKNTNLFNCLYFQFLSNGILWRKLPSISFGMHDDRSLVKHAFVVRQSFAIGYKADRYTPTVKITV